MKPSISRRDFLKIASFLPLATPILSASNPITSESKTDADTPNILIIIFDAFSASDASLYGFKRDTTPNLKRFAEHATVYHAHYAAGNFTTPGTSSILTGTYPWTHRAWSHHATVINTYLSKNIFSVFGESNYTRVGFSHNLLVSILLDSLKDHIEEFILPNEIALVDFNFSDDLLRKDFGIAAQSERRYFKKPGMLSDSLFLFPILTSIRDKYIETLTERVAKKYPLGIPGYHDMLYPLEDTIDWIKNQIRKWPQPFISYLHMMPPHDPYRPREEFTHLYYDGWHPESKPDHFFADFYDRQHILDGHRVRYDQFIRNVDTEFGRLHDFLEAEGIFENSIVVLTSDHGEMFERKIWKHTTQTLFQPVIHVPLLISTPGQTARQDVYSSTSCVDLLPTLLHLTGRSIPEWSEGTVLPPFASQQAPDERSIFVVEAKSNPKLAPLRKATVAMIKGDYKIIYYRGYEGYSEVYELYNLRDDPEELINIYSSHPAIASELQGELRAKIEEKDAPFVPSTSN